MGDPSGPVLKGEQDGREFVFTQIDTRLGSFPYHAIDPRKPALECMFSISKPSARSITAASLA